MLTAGAFARHSVKVTVRLRFGRGGRISSAKLLPAAGSGAGPAGFASRWQRSAEGEADARDIDRRAGSELSVLSGRRWRCPARSRRTACVVGWRASRWSPRRRGPEIFGVRATGGDDNVERGAERLGEIAVERCAGAGMGNRQIVNDAISMMSWNRMWRKALQRLTIASSFHPSRVVAPVSCAHLKQARADSFPLPGRALFGEALRNQSVAVHPNASRVSPVGVGVGSHPSACPSISRQAWQILCVSWKRCSRSSPPRTSRSCPLLRLVDERGHVTCNFGWKRNI